MVLFLVTQECDPDLVKPLHPKDLFGNDLVLLPITANSEEEVKEYARLLSHPLFRNKEIKLYCDFSEFVKLKDCKDFQIIVDPKHHECDFSTYVLLGWYPDNIEVLVSDDAISLKELLSEKEINLFELNSEHIVICRRTNELSK